MSTVASSPAPIEPHSYFYPGGSRLALSAHPTPTTLYARPLLPEDLALYIEFVENLSMEDLQTRLHGAGFKRARTIDPEVLRRMLDVNPKEEVVLGVMARSGTCETLLAVARARWLPRMEEADFALTVRSDHKREGLGRRALQALIDYCRALGIKTLVGETTCANTPMLHLARSFGFSTSACSDNEVMLRRSLQEIG